MSHTDQDQWAQWLLGRRFGGDPERLQAQLQELYPVRDRVLQNAQLTAGEVLLDVGAGDGLIAFGALQRVGQQGTVIFSDISQDLLAHSRTLAAQMRVLEQCRFILAPATDLSVVADASVDVVTTRSVLIYVEDRLKAFAEFYRVLKPKGRLSIFEPINRFMVSDHSCLFFGQDVTPVLHLADKVRAIFERYQPPDTDPMLNFDERDLLHYAEQAGFREIHLDYQAEIKPGGWWGTDWDSLLQMAGNPKIPSLGEAIQQALTLAEARQFEAYMRPRIEKADGTGHFARAYLWAVKRDP
jgi:arsenite methyltransferase